MPRPVRIEYPNALYHIMNRGRGRQNIFHSHKYFASFLDCLSEANQKFGCIVHAYCLMRNHFHLVVEIPLETPEIRAAGAQTLHQRIDDLQSGRFKMSFVVCGNYVAVM